MLSPYIFTSILICVQLWYAYASSSTIGHGVTQDNALELFEQFAKAASHNPNYKLGPEWRDHNGKLKKVSKPPYGDGLVVFDL